MARLWRKYLVTRRDGTIPEWPYFVLGAADPCAPTALRAYADAAAAHGGLDPEYIADVVRLATQFETWAETNSAVGDPDAPPHRIDDPQTVAKMEHGPSVVEVECKAAGRAFSPCSGPVDQYLGVVYLRTATESLRYPVCRGHCYYEMGWQRTDAAWPTLVPITHVGPVHL